MQNTMQAAAGTGGKPSGRWAGQHKVLAFTLGGERFGIEIGAIKEIIEYRALTAVPLTPDTISGVLNLRGDVVPVISLARRLGLEPAAVGKRTCILVIEAREGEFSLDLGIVVDMVNEVVDVEGADIEPAPAFGTSIPADYIGGMLRRGEDFTALLALERVLAIPELMVPATRLNA
ncbi:MAG: chemotaxis protein CheW [Pseudomonadota bacterium]